MSYTFGEKREIVERILCYLERNPRVSVSKACRMHGISRGTYYRWLKQYNRYLRGESTAMEPKKRGPKVPPRKTPPDTRDYVIKLAREEVFHSFNQLVARIRADKACRIHRRTVIGILGAAGMKPMIERRRKTSQNTNSMH